MSSLVKTILIVVIIGAVGFFGYNYLSRDTSGGDLVVVQGSDTSQMGAQVLTALNQLKQLRLDDSVFSNKTFKSLRDFSRPIPSEPVGRSNPFAPLGVDSQKTVVTSASSTSPSPRQTKTTPQKTVPKQQAPQPDANPTDTEGVI